MASVFSQGGTFKVWSRRRGAWVVPRGVGDGRAGAALGHVRPLRVLEAMARQLRGPADPGFLAQMGWVAACPADSPLPADVMSRAAAGAGGRPETLALARLLVMRSVRSDRWSPRYLDQARGTLQLHRQLRHGDVRVALWLSVLYLLRGYQAEARREAAGALGGPLGPLAEELRRAADRWPTGRPGAAAETERAEGARPAGPQEGVRLLQGRPMGSGPARMDLLVRARRGQAVELVGSQCRIRLAPVEGELAIGLLALSWASWEVRDPDGWVARSRWAGVVWPMAQQPVGRLSGFFAQVMRHVRDKAEAAAGQPVIETTHRLGYRLRPAVAVALDVDLATWAGNYVMACLPAGPAAGGEDHGS